MELRCEHLLEQATSMAARRFEILAYEETSLGPLCLRRRELLSEPGTLVTEVTLNHEFLMSSLHTDSEQALARTARELHGGENLSVLVGGLGLGYTAQAALSSPVVKTVDVIEFLPQVIDWLREGLLPLSSELNADERLMVTSGDIYAMLSQEPSRRFDLILIDVDHSPDDTLDEGDGDFYTESGLQLAREHLQPGGLLGVWSYAESSPFEAALRRVFRDVSVQPVTYRNRHVGGDYTDWLFFARG